MSHEPMYVSHALYRSGKHLHMSYEIMTICHELMCVNQTE